MTMTPSLIEAVARAIYLAQTEHYGGRWELVETKDVWFEAARVALVAIEKSGYVVVPVEPTEGMLAASLAADVGTGTRETQRNEYAARPKAVKP